MNIYAFPGATQNVAVGATSAQSAALGPVTTRVRLVSTVDCWVAFGPAAVATTASMFLPAGKPEQFKVAPSMLIAVIRDASSGTLNITEMST